MVEVDLSPIYTFRYIEIPKHGFSYLMLDENFRALHTPFKCKDYLHDIFYSEYTGRDAEVYGIEWEPGRLDIKQDYFKLALLGNNLWERIPHMLSMIHDLEKAQDIPECRIHQGQNEGIIVLEFSKKWTTSGPLLSVLATAVRMSGGYSGEGIIEYLKKLQGLEDKQNTKPDYISFEAQAAEKLLPRFAAILQGRKVDASWTMFDDDEEPEYCSCGCGELISGRDAMEEIHETGMLNYEDFPQVNLD